jgi:hypothetical protein
MTVRSAQDRRKWNHKAVFPLRDHHGNVIRCERRMQADRRLGQIETEWLEIMQESGRSTVSR